MNSRRMIKLIKSRPMKRAIITLEIVYREGLPDPYRWDWTGLIHSFWLGREPILSRITKEEIEAYVPSVKSYTIVEPYNVE